MNGTSEPHAGHDRYLVAALAADDVEPMVRVDAEALVASCHDCAELLVDLRSIAVATAALPMVPRTRDFRISAADAARLRPRGWRALLDALGGARASFSRPLATGLTTLGIVGLLVSTIPGALSGISLGGGSAGAAPISAQAPEVGRNSAGSPSSAYGGSDSASQAPALLGSAAPSVAASAAAASAAATTPTQVKVDQPSPGAEFGSAGQAVGSARPVTDGNGGVGVPPGGSKGGPRAGAGAEARGLAMEPAVRDAALPVGGRTTGPSLLLIGSIVCLALGAGLFAIQRLARQ